MSGFSRRPLAVVICCLFAGTQVGYAAIDVERGAEGGARPSGAENPPVLLAASDAPLNLRKGRKYNILKKKEAVGRRLDFMMQEFNRESNTLASKSINAEVTNSAIELKVLIEQMREQIQNIE